VLVDPSVRLPPPDAARDQSMKTKTRTFTAAGVGVGKRASGHCEVLADLGPSRRTNLTRWVLALAPWHGRIFDGFLLAVDYIMRLVAVAFLMKQFGFHGEAPLIWVRYMGNRI
jgi:hypothetical protein